MDKIIGKDQRKNLKASDMDPEMTENLKEVDKTLSLVVPEALEEDPQDMSLSTTQTQFPSILLAFHHGSNCQHFFARLCSLFCSF